MSDGSLCLICFPSLRSQLLPLHALLLPLQFGSDAPQISLDDGVASPRYPRQEEYLLLYVRCQMQEVHDLGHASAGHVTHSGNFSVVGDGPVPDHSIQLDSQGHDARDAWNTPCG